MSKKKLNNKKVISLHQDQHQSQSTEVGDYAGVEDSIIGDAFDDDYLDESDKDDGPENFTEFLNMFFERDPISNPFNTEDQEYVMAIITTGTRALIGGIASFSEGFLSLYYPLAYGEIPVQTDEAGRVTKVGSSFHKHFVMLRTLDWQLVRADTIHVLRADKSEDKMLVQEYEKVMKQILANDSNIVIAQTMPNQTGPQGV